MGKRKSRKRSHQQFAEDYTEGVNVYDDSSYVDETSIARSLDQSIHHYEHTSQMPAQIRRYFFSRYKIFSKYDEGIWMTNAAWYGVTQECVASKIAFHIHKACKLENPGILDVMAGAGGNTIGFAKSGHFHRTYAFEKDANTLRCAQHNAEIYGVHTEVSWFDGDCFDMIASNRGLQVLAKDYGIIFCSPPWGGPEYQKDPVFNLDTMEPYPLRKLYDEFSKYTDHIVLYLPRTSDLRQIAELVEDGKKVNVIHYCTEGSSRALCVYFGPFDFSFLKQ